MSWSGCFTCDHGNVWTAWGSYRNEHSYRDAFSHFDEFAKTVNVSVSKETKATVEGISSLKEAFQKTYEIFGWNKLHQSEEVSSQNVEMSFKEKIKDEI